MSETFDFTQALADMDGGVLLAKLSRAVQETARGTAEHGEKGKTGKVTLELVFSRIGESNQVDVTHTVTYAKPTRRGKATETDKTSTPFHVTGRGHLSIVPTTGDLFTPKHEERT